MKKKGLRRILLCYVIDKQSAGSSTIIRTCYGTKTFLSSLGNSSWNSFIFKVHHSQYPRFVILFVYHQLLSFVLQIPHLQTRNQPTFHTTIIFVLPIVKSCTGWKRLSVNCNNKHDLPTPDQVNKCQMNPMWISNLYRQWWYI